MAHTGWSDIKGDVLSDSAYREAWEAGEVRARFGDAMREARRAAGLTQVQLADRLGMQQADISRLELGRADPRLTTLMRLAVVLGDWRVSSATIATIAPPAA